jgi:hypothetical protein
LLYMRYLLSIKLKQFQLKALQRKFEGTIWGTTYSYSH